VFPVAEAEALRIAKMNEKFKKGGNYVCGLSGFIKVIT